ncbi:methylated-DNA--[protein]-cysteine S-methyltransferase [Hephaestia sp. GCM10023244]|uniref:methylated-DNA--[protein]-cysteine S-methyltransferase n=1 Tax=unclassified Hephaestia TaxID=2631281 RepID=UPI0020778509|nr:methylated-DNA--[protein]-cysteine S-methyltransferase [Hephaestia sp. MAHUQ-44]MCM8731987.1 methylated-DNA--[protein]-cysteine S-methyltransferase [Hephaestia sp. MAHUQ-44]
MPFINPAPHRPNSGRETESAEAITFRVIDTELGQILVARSALGVCALLIGSGADTLAGDLESRFPSDQAVRSEDSVRADFDKVLAFLDAPAEGLDLDLDLRGTSFPQQIWKVLRSVPASVTLSYAELARRVGAPKAVRAVASACTANVVALAIPCHRVVRSDGALSGYAWGVERKRALLDREARA